MLNSAAVQSAWICPCHRQRMEIRTMQSSDKYALVTGGTDGVGKEIVLGLARAGHSVIIVGRDVAKGARVERELREISGNVRVWFRQADLSLMREAEWFAEEVTR